MHGSRDAERESEDSTDRDRTDAGSNERSTAIERLHRSVGNRAVARLHESGSLSSPGSSVRSTDGDGSSARGSPDVWRSTEGGESGGQSTLSGDAEGQVRSVQGGGRSMDEGTRSFFESRMGADFSDVRIHTGGNADRAARSIDAEAFTTGTDVAFRRGNYDPSSSDGKRLLAHELTHVTQQREGTGSTVQRQNDGESNGGDAGEGGTNAGAATGGNYEDVHVLLTAMETKSFEDAMMELALAGGETDPQALGRKVAKFRQSPQWQNQGHEAQAVSKMNRLVRNLEAMARAGVSEAVMNVVQGLDLPREKKSRLLRAIAFPYPRPDLSDETIRKISARDEDNPEGLAEGDRMTLLGALEHPALTRENTDVQGLDTEGGGYAEASSGNVQAFREFFEAEIPGNLSLTPDDLLKQSSDLREQHPEVSEDSQPLELPPESVWSQMGPTLDLIGRFGDMSGVSFSVESSYRSELVNALAGGALGSKHMSFAGLDLQPSDPARFEAFVKFFWWERGRNEDLGLGFYRPRRIHVDTLGFRRWAEPWDGEPRSTSRQRFRDTFGVNSVDQL